MAAPSPLLFTPSTTSISGTSDKNSQGTLKPDGAISGTYSVNSSGVGLIPSGCTLTGASANCQNLLVVISPTKAVIVGATPASGTQNIAPKITVSQQ